MTNPNTVERSMTDKTREDETGCPWTVERPHPFTKTYIHGWDDGPTCFVGWRPGAWAQKADGPDSAVAAAHAMGTCRFDVLGEYKPGRFPTRVFFTQTYIAPDGTELRGRGLRIKVKHHFVRQTQHIGFEFEIDPDLEVTGNPPS